MINLSTTVFDKDFVMIIYQNGYPIKTKMIGHKMFKTVKGLSPGTYQVAGRSGI